MLPSNRSDHRKSASVLSSFSLAMLHLPLPLHSHRLLPGQDRFPDLESLKARVEHFIKASRRHRRYRRCGEQAALSARPNEVGEGSSWTGRRRKLMAVQATGRR